MIDAMNGSKINPSTYKNYYQPISTQPQFNHTISKSPLFKKQYNPNIYQLVVKKSRSVRKEVMILDQRNEDRLFQLNPVNRLAKYTTLNVFHNMSNIEAVYHYVRNHGLTPIFDITDFLDAKHYDDTIKIVTDYNKFLNQIYITMYSYKYHQYFDIIADVNPVKGLDQQINDTIKKVVISLLTALKKQNCHKVLIIHNHRSLNLNDRPKNMPFLSDINELSRTIVPTLYYQNMNIHDEKDLITLKLMNKLKKNMESVRNNTKYVQ